MRPSGGSSRRRRGRTTDEARLVERFKRLGPQQAAFKLALRPFCDDTGAFDRRLWAEAFTSSEPERIVTVTAATGLYVGLVNHLIEMLQVAARLRGLEVARRDKKPEAPVLLAAVREDGGLTDNQVTVLKRLYATRNELQHSSPGVEAGEIYDEFALLPKTLGRFATSYLEWLQRHGVDLR